MIGRTLLGCCLATAALSPLPAWAEVPHSMGILRDALLVGDLEDGSWTGIVDGERYVLSNDSDPASIHYAYVDGAALPQRLRVSVDVVVDGADSGRTDLVVGAGILYAFRHDPLSYLAVVLTEDGTLQALERAPAGMRQVDAIRIADFDPQVPHEVRLVEYIDGITAVVDGEDAIDLFTDSVGTGTIGIVAFGTGSFAFQNFTVTEVRGLFVSAQQVGYGRDVQR